MNRNYKLRPLLMFCGEYTNDTSLNREGVANTAEIIKQAVFSVPGLNINPDNGCVVENMAYVPACEKIAAFIQSINVEQDIAFIYYCGHGFPDYRNNTVHLAFSDTTRNTSLMCGYNAKALIELLKDSGVNRYILILDCCHSGYMCDMGADDIIELESHLQEGYVHIYSARSTEICQQTKINDKYYIPFSYWLAKSLTNTNYQSISINNIYDKIKNEINLLAKNTDYKANCGIQCTNSFGNNKIFNIVKQEATVNETSGFKFSSYFTMEKLKILLVKTSIKYPIKYDDFGIPLGLWMLKGHLSTAGHNFDVDIYDERLELKKCGDNENLRKEVYDRFEKIVKDYDVVGISLSTSEVFPAIEKFRIAKNYDKITFAGGIFTSSNEEFLLKSDVVDYVIPGVGTVPLSDLLSRLYREKQENRLGKRVLTVSGVASKDLNILDSIWCPSQLPTMRKSLWIQIIETYGNYIDNKVDVYTARGCERHCVFCSVQRESRQVVYRKDDTKVIDEINFLKSIGVTYFSFKDEDFLSFPNRMLNILENVKGENIKFKIRARYDEMSNGNISLKYLQSLGVDEIQYGLESPDWSIRKSVNKGDHCLVSQDNASLIDFIRSHSFYNITANCSFILGIEGEDSVYYNNLFEFIKKIYDNDSKPKVYINFLTPHPYNSQISLSKYSLVTKDLNYFTHKYPVCFAESAKAIQRRKILSTYDDIVKYTKSELYNPLTDKIPSVLKESFLRGDKCQTNNIEYPN
ncbi:MAG: B12 binding domain protein [Firmicutes bacterium ADurb.Bin193]|nr:MAG: B12 binding domain protein [Firmicutes bacterium ADurb.Bin193]